MKNKTPLFLLIFFNFSICYCYEISQVNEISSKLIYFSSPQRDSTKIDFSTINTTDSAFFKEPKIRKVLDKRITNIELNVLCKADSVCLYVKHSGNKIDTLGILISPPYKIQWDYSSLPDQDQLNLQFGYIIFHPSGKKIVSNPLPHRWVIDRHKKKNKNKYHCRQLLYPDTVFIDGNLEEWNKIETKKIDNGGFFALQWDGLYLYFAVNIKTSKISVGDFVELHLDSYFTRESFADEKCRSIRFSPKGRTFCLVSSMKDSGNYSQNDSIAALLLENIKTGITLTHTGYVIEAAIPFYALSALHFPKQKMGMDVSVVYSDSTVKYYGWTNKNPYSRYNPSEWGILILHQGFWGVRFFLMVSFIILILVIILIGSTMVIHFFKTQKYESMERKGGSNELNKIEEEIEKTISDPELSEEKISKSTGFSPEIICNILRKELNCTFEQFVTNKRVQLAKKKLWNLSLSLEDIAKECGFTSENKMKEIFLSLLKTEPQSFRKRVKEFYEEE